MWRFRLSLSPFRYRFVIRVIGWCLSSFIAASVIVEMESRAALAMPNLYSRSLFKSLDPLLAAALVGAVSSAAVSGYRAWTIHPGHLWAVSAGLVNWSLMYNYTNGDSPLTSVLEENKEVCGDRGRP